jgi:hypothetical protein
MTTGCFWWHTCLVYTKAQKLSSSGRIAAVTSNGHQRSSLVVMTCFALWAGTKAALYLTIDTRSWMHGMHGGSTEQIRRDAHGKQGLVRNNACYGG